MPRCPVLLRNCKEEFTSQLVSFRFTPLGRQTRTLAIATTPALFIVNSSRAVGAAGSEPCATMQHPVHLRGLRGRSGCAGRPMPSPAGLPASLRRRRGRIVPASAGSNGGTVDASSAADKSREIARMLLNTQKNMLAINNSRVKVQEELAVANRRIADLERELERLRAEAAANAVKEAQLPPPFSNDRGIAFAAPQPPQQYEQPPPQQQYQQQPPQHQQAQGHQQQHQPQQQHQHQAPQQQQQPQAPVTGGGAPTQPAPVSTITLTYVTGWHNVFIHYSLDGQAWTNVPGVRMANVSGDHNAKSIVLSGSKLEFVLNNGDNDWDSPGRYTDSPKNYVITGPGAWRLKSGKLEKTG